MDASEVLESDGPEQTERIAARLAGRLQAGDVVLVVGDVGAGKTTFVRGACRALGVEERVTSPTFTIGQLYAGRGGMSVAHLDLYRLGSLDEEEPGLLDEYLTGDSIGFVEWPDAGATELRDPAARVLLEHAGGDRRRIRIDAR